MERLIKVGKITPKHSHDVKKSRIGIGFEKLDRDVFDPEKAYDKVAELGVKYARLQSGWQRTEKEKGVYDFAWLDKIVDRFISLDIEPWLCLCYGNPLYTPLAAKYFGSVGIAPVDTEEEMLAWLRYVEATVEHFKGRIHYFEVWNEPDGKSCWKHEKDIQLWGEFTRRTALACKKADPTCEVSGLALCKYEEFAAAFAATGVLDYLDAVSYHAYSAWDEVWKGRINLFKSWRIHYNKPKLKIIQGESGTQSRSGGSGALHQGAWSKEKQVKYLLRHLITDLAMGVEFTSYFSCMDMIEALRGLTGNVASYLDYGYFGVLGADFDENGRSVGTYSPKPSYFALQTLCSVMAEDPRVSEIPVEALRMQSPRIFDVDFDFAETEHYAFEKEDGTAGLFYWVNKNLMTETYEGTVSLFVPKEWREKGMHLVNMADGTVYDFSEDMLEEDGILKHIPVTDTPMMLMFGDFCDWQ
jgi:hypothetical protein